MTGDDERDRVGAERQADSSRVLRAADSQGDPLVRPYAPVWDAPDGPPDPSLKSRPAGEVDRNINIVTLPGQKGHDLRLRGV